MSMPDDRAPFDHYGEALRSAVAMGCGPAEAQVVVAITAQVTEAIEDTLRPHIGKRIYRIGNVIVTLDGKVIGRC